jgi:diadenosine tetraphosphatase ApaH/serine/threonine PP2A family protein phosphatase
MRFAVIADVHANLHALEAALGFLSDQDVDAYLCAGDLVGYGPFPNECVRRVRDLPGRCVAGNHDLIVVGRRSDERCVPLAQTSLRWTRTVLDPEARAFLAALPLGASEDGVALRHGSVVDPEEYVLTEDRAASSLRDIRRIAPGTEILILGHTHRPMAFGEQAGWLLRETTGAVSIPPGQAMVLNPGAVGQSRSRDDRTRLAVLDTTAREVTFHAVPYDVEACRRALQDRGLPPQSCHVPRSRWDGIGPALWRRVRRLARRPRHRS